jgi:hydrogenase expression/formation protein HypC
MCLGVPARVIRVDGSEALVAIGNVEYNVSLMLCDDILEGDFILMHAGFAISRIEPLEAEEMIRLFKEISESEQRGN